MESKRRFRPELEGLRIVAAVLVPIYHILFNRVSSGVNIFLIVLGFLITTLLFSMSRENGKILYFSYVVKLLKRLLPTASIQFQFYLVWLLVFLVASRILRVFWGKAH